ncbi:PTS mannose transporter subunit IIAB [Clostridium botulinum]|uniref:Mannose-specific phosphotransferase system component IIAB n=1 Tax=Clostridium botulinum CFSAN001627 TaxID=1232189 RepID=M1ZUF8_CLOBO|nr:mannose-specific phosphotransferase system component iiab [Clostridium botulinum A3 str. Loch Maree]EKN43492.1 mannose-specific phosphotransferase system component IIAB [Clostridium botulinum CFSAN001627]EPS52987.1 mannose-specific phosphotransferase system component IIAB [Clostridium botulinum A1 str. CFSAN002368]OPD29836.1 PTS mannose transporter subunit IIAB [Clostridium botulinum]OPD30170.1 PTS mannose transporter subunit IIAB [Clostridium botulinum]
MIFGAVHHSIKQITLFEEHKDKWAIVAGMNLPMLIEAYGARLSMQSAQEIAAYILKLAKEGVKVKPEKLEPADTGKTFETSAQQSNVGAPGSFKYVLARIDSRLLHGQVATA